MFIVLKPFLITIFSSAILAYILYPLFKWIKKLIKSKHGAATITVIVLLLIFVIPLIIMLFYVQPYITSFYTSTKDAIATTSFSCLPDGSLLSSAKMTLCNYYQSFRGNPYIQRTLISLSEQVLPFFLNLIKSLFLNLPSMIINVFISIFVVYYLLVDGDQVIKFLRRVTPLNNKRTDDLFHRTNFILRGIIFGSIVVGLIQALVALIGYYIAGSFAPILLGIITFFFVFIPVLGAVAVWAPVSIILLLQGNIFGAVFLILYGVFIISMTDNLLRPFLVGNTSKIHPVLVLLGVLGGVAVFGLMGVFIGPVILGLAVEIIGTYIER